MQADADGFGNARFAKPGQQPIETSCVEDVIALHLRN
jgi:hypothetical protein